jgi:hypothetical protein
LAYIDGECRLHVVGADGSGDYMLADLEGDIMGAGVYYEDLVDDFIRNDDFFDRMYGSVLNYVLWSQDYTRIGISTEQCGSVVSAIVTLDGRLEEGALGATTSDPLVGSTDVPNVFLKDEQGALYYYTYEGISIKHLEPEVSNHDLIGDLEARSAMVNWGFHSNFWIRDADGQSHRLTDTPSYKWQGMWSPDRAWVVFTELLVRQGYLDDSFNAFDGDLSMDIWALHPQTGTLLRVTDIGNAHLPSWQPVAIQQ